MNTLATPTSRNQGFALVIALSLMAMIVLLLVSLSTTLQVELTSASHNRSMQEARMNAILGMQVALGQLQQHAGPDQRVTAPATAVFPNDATTPTMLELFKDYAEPSFGFKTYLNHEQQEGFDTAVAGWWNDRNPHWLSVWNSELAAGTPNRNQLPVWLVSGNENFILQADDTEYPSGYLTPDTLQSELDSTYTPTDFVYLVNTGSSVISAESNDGYDGRVRALKQPVASNSVQTGHYAYWVGDESLKANFTIRDPYYGNDDTQSREYRNRLQSPQRIGWENIEGFADIVGKADGPDIDDPRLELLISSDQIELLDPDQGRLVEPARRNFHNLTAYSRSLLTDTARGGLKKDLTVYFDDGDMPATGGILDSAPIPDPDFSDELGYTLDNRFGNSNSGFPNTYDNIPTWEQLKFWYENDPAIGDVVEVNEDFAPVVTYVRLFFGFSYSYHPDTGKGTIYMHVLPTIVLWNPYDAGLEEVNYQVRITYPMKFRNFMMASQNTDTAATGGVLWPDDVNPQYLVHYLDDNVTNSDEDIEASNFNNDSIWPAYEFRPWGEVNNGNLVEDGELVFNFSTSLEAGESRVFTVGNDFDVDRLDEEVVIQLENIFYADEAPSARFPIFNVSNPPQFPLDVNGFYDPDQLRFFSDADGISHHYGVRLLAQDELIYEAERFGYMQSQYVPMNLNYGRHRDEFEMRHDGSGIDMHRDPRLWRTLYYSDQSDVDAITTDYFTEHVGSETDSSNNGTNIKESPIFAAGHSYLTPFGTLVSDPYNHHRHIDLFYRSMATHNLSSKSPNVNPLVDRNRGIFAGNNDDSFGRFKYGQGDAIAGWNNTQHRGLKWDLNLGNYVDGVMQGSSLITYRYPEPQDSDNEAAPILPTRLVKRPEAELVSIGQLQQANLSKFLWQPAFPIGNAEASPYVDRELMAGIESRQVQTSQRNWETVPNDGQNHMIDLSYLLNDALWDRYFLSTIPQSGNLDFESDPDWPNSRHRIRDKSAAPTVVRDFDKAAAYIHNVGALNVNSTSVEAWKSLLTAFRDLHIEIPDDAGTTESNPVETVPISRTLKPLDGPIRFTFDDADVVASDFGAEDPNTSNKRDYARMMSGFRFLSDEMIQELAERIVDEVRLRGPFLSLADFVNRRLVAPDKNTNAWEDARVDNGNVAYAIAPIDSSYDPMIGVSGINGALQRAINLSGINGGVNYPEISTRGFDRAYGLWPSRPGTTNATRKFYNVDGSLRYYVDMEHIAGAPSGEFGQLMSHLPGFVTQGDLLSMIGPALTARGDTFMIRSYGDSIDPLSGEEKAKAWLEVIVQRTVEPVVDSNNDFEPDVGAQNQGRRFKIISLRWLNEEDV